MTNSSNFDKIQLFKNVPFNTFYYINGNGQWTEFPTSSGGSSTEPLRYKALLTQTLIETSSGVLEVGKTYLINTLQVGDDFSNVGYVADGVEFIATGTTPTNWTNSTFVVNITDSQPVVDLLENTLTITATFDYTNGLEFNSAGLFLSSKTYISGQLSLNATRISNSIIRCPLTDVQTLSILIEVYP